MLIPTLVYHWFAIIYICHIMRDMRENYPKPRDDLVDAASAAGVVKRRGRFLTLLLGPPGPNWIGSGAVATKTQQTQAAEKVAARMEELRKHSEEQTKAHVRSEMLQNGLDPNNLELFGQHFADFTEKQAREIRELLDKPAS